MNCGGSMATSVKFYFDEHMPRKVERALLERGIEVIMAVDVGMVDKDDDGEHLPFATQLGAVLVTRDHPFAGRTQSRFDHAGLICWNGPDNDFGGMVRVLTQFTTDYTAESAAGQVFWLR